MAVDMSAFDRFKNQPKAGLPNQVDMSAFGLKWKEPVDIPKPPAEPAGLVKTMAPELARSAAEGFGDWYNKEAELQRNMGGMERAVRNVTQPAKFVLDMTRYIAGSLSSLGKSALETVYAPVLGKEYVRQQLSEPAFEKFLFKDETKSYQQMKEGIDKYTKESPLATPWEKKWLGTTLALGTFASDAWPGKPNPKKGIEVLIKELAAETTGKGAKKKLLEFGVEKTVAERIARQVPQSNTDEAVVELIQREAQVTLKDIAKTAPAPLEKTPERLEKEAFDASPAGRRQVDATQAITKASDDLAAQAAKFDNVDDFIKSQTTKESETKIWSDAAEKQATKIEGGDIKVTKSDTGNKWTFDIGDGTVRTSPFNTKQKTLAFAEAERKKALSFLKEGGFIEQNTRWMNAPDSGVFGEAELREVFSRVKKEIPKTGIPDTAPKVEYKGESVKINDVAPEQKLKATDEDLKPLKEMAARDTSKLQPSRATGKTTGRDLAEEIALREKKFESKMTDPEIAKIREENLLTPESIDEIILRKRGIITDEMAIDRAKRIQGTLQDVIDLPKGTTATTEQMRAIRQIVAEEEEINKALRNLRDFGGASSTPAERKALKRLNADYENMPEEALLNRAYQESTYNLKKAQIVEMALGSEAGRTLSGLRKLNDAFDSRMRTLFNRINKNKKLTEEEKGALLDMIAKLDTSDDKEFLKAVEMASSADWFDKVAEWSVAAKLWNPTTHFVNFGGNTLRQAADIGIVAVTDPRNALADMHGAIVGFKQGLKNAARAFTDEGYAQQLAKHQELGGTAPAIGGKLGKYIRTPFRALGASDEIFRAMGYQRQLYRDAHAQALKEGLSGKQLEARMTELLNAPTFKMMERATDNAKHLTFQDDMGEVSKWIDKGRDPSRFKNRGAKTAATGFRFFVPFLKTPVNLFKQSVDFSPIGLIKNWNTIKGNDAAARKAIGEAILGTAIATYIVMETLDGNVTGGAPSDPAEKDRFYRENKQPYSMKINGRWWEYKRIDPFATIIGLTTDMVTLEEKDFGSLIGVVTENLKDKTYLSGVSDMMKMLTGEDWERDYAFKSMLLGAAIPSIVGHTTRSIDPTIRQVDTFSERAQALIPGMSDDLPARVNVLGYDVERANKGLNYFFNPIQSTTAEIDPITRGLMAIDKTLSVPGKTFSRDGVSYELSPEDYERFARQVGTDLRRQLAEEFKSPRYQRMDTEEKQARVDKIRREIMDEWKDEYVKRKGGRRPIEEVISEVFGT